MTFVHPLWLIPVPLLLLAFWRLRVSVIRDDWSRVVHPELLRWYQGDERNKGRRITALLLASIVSAALASPSIPANRNSTDDNQEVFAHAEGWLIVVDVSKSVTLTDVVPNRLHVMRETARVISQQAGAIPVGLIIYAGDAFLIAPPAIDKQFLEEKLSLLEYGLVTTEGSNPTRAIALTNSVIQSTGFARTRTFLLSDGGGLGSRSSPAIASLATAGNRVDLLLFGDETPAGEATINAQDLQNLADIANGKVLRSDMLGNIPLQSLQLNRRVDASSLVDRGGFAMLSQSNQSHWLLLLAMPLCLWMFTRERSR